MHAVYAETRTQAVIMHAVYAETRTQAVIMHGGYARGPREVSG